MSPFFAQKVAAIVMALLAVAILLAGALTGPESLSKMFKSSEAQSFARFIAFGVAVFLAIVSHTLFVW